MSAATRPVLRITIAGGGIAGCILASQLKAVRGVAVDVREKRPVDELPAGLNLLLNHNGMAALADIDPILAAAVRGRGHDVVGWSARTMAGRELYNIEDAKVDGLASHDGVMARWDEVNAVVQRACWDRIKWDQSCTSYRYALRADRATVIEAIHSDGTVAEADLLVGCDGRYSAVRKHMEGGDLPRPRIGPIATFRAAISEDQLPPELHGLISDIQDCMRIYNAPDVRCVAPGGRHAALAHDDDFAKHCMRGLVRAGVLRIRPPPPTSGSAAEDAAGPVRLGVWGNVGLPPSSQQIPPAAKTAAGFDALFTPAAGADSLHGIGRLVHHVLTHHAEEAHWVRHQETEQRCVDDGGRVLLVGDSAGAIYPSIGQGANLAIEDACVAAVVLRCFAEAAVAAGAERVNVPAATRAIAAFRQPRREAVAAISREHALHLAPAAVGNTADCAAAGWGGAAGARAAASGALGSGSAGEASLDADAADWLGRAGGHFPRGVWRERLRELWAGWPRVAHIEAAVVKEARRAAAAAAAPGGTCIGVGRL